MLIYKSFDPELIADYITLRALRYADQYGAQNTLFYIDLE